MARDTSSPKSKPGYRSGRITWNRELKQTVYIIFHDLSHRGPQATQIFNVLHKTYLAECGLPSGVAGNVLQAQYGEHRKAVRHADWESICGPAVDEEEIQRRQEICDRISSIAASTATMSSSSDHPKTRTAVFASSISSRKVGLSRTRGPRVSKVRTPSPPHTSVSVTVAPLTPPRTPHSKVPFVQSTGKVILVSPARYMRANQAVRPVPDVIAHPPWHGPLFRVWSAQPRDGDCAGRDSEDGFVSRRYFQAPIWPSKPPDLVDVADVFAHLNKDKRETPFISTSCNLAWIIRLALRRGPGLGNQGHLMDQMRLSIIDSQAIDPKAVYWARPQHEAIVHKAEFTNGAQYYRGTYEYLIWRNIPKEAMVRTVSLHQLANFWHGTPEVRDVLAHELLGNTSFAESPKKLKALKVPLNQKAALAIAKLARFLGFTADSREHLSYIVSEVVSGWHLEVTHKIEEEWLDLATTFAKEMLRHGSFRAEQQLKLAFLNGVYWGMGDSHARFTSEASEKVYRKALKCGLGSPAKIIANELDGIKMSILADTKVDTQQLQRYHARLKQQADEREEDDGDKMPAQADDETTFEFSEDGVVL